MTSAASQTGLALDVGERRIGVARANLAVRMANPLTTLQNPDTFIPDVVGLAEREAAAWIVIGLPRGLDGQETAQTARVQEFGVALEKALQSAGQTVPIHWIDEALTSAKAEAELARRGKAHAKAEVDALAATYILEDFLMEQA